MRVVPQDLERVGVRLKRLVERFRGKKIVLLRPVEPEQRRRARQSSVQTKAHSSEPRDGCDDRLCRLLVAEQLSMVCIYRRLHRPRRTGEVVGCGSPRTRRWNEASRSRNRTRRRRPRTGLAPSEKGPLRTFQGCASKAGTRCPCGLRASRARVPRPRSSRPSWTGSRETPEYGRQRGP